MKQILICLCFLIAAVIPSRSQTTKGEPAFFIIFNSLTKKCTVMEKMPQTDTPNITLASDSIYKTRAEAEAAIKTVKPCHE
jgi:hypothetical protein